MVLLLLAFIWNHLFLLVFAGVYALFILGMVSLVGCKREELGMQEASGIKRFFAENQTKKS